MVIWGPDSCSHIHQCKSRLALLTSVELLQICTGVRTTEFGPSFSQVCSFLWYPSRLEFRVASICCTLVHIRYLLKRICYFIYFYLTFVQEGLILPARFTRFTTCIFENRFLLIRYAELSVMFTLFLNNTTYFSVKHQGRRKSHTKHHCPKMEENKITISLNAQV